jgi:hypothetical protein
MTRNRQHQTPKPASLSELARHLLLTREEVRWLIAERLIERRTDGNFDLDAARQSYIRFLRDRRSNRGEAEAALQRAKAIEIELRVAERAHQLIELDEAFAALDDIVGRIVSELSGLPAVATRDLTMRRHLEGLVHGIRQRAADRLGKQAESLRSTGAATS